MADTAQATDKGFGLGVLFTILALFGAAAMYVGAPDDTTLAAGGFAAAITFGTIVVVALHVHDA